MDSWLHLGAGRWVNLTQLRGLRFHADGTADIYWAAILEPCRLTCEEAQLVRDRLEPRSKVDGAGG